MSSPDSKAVFDRLQTSVKQFDVSGKTLLLPSMSPTAGRLLEAAFRAMGVNAVVMETYKGLALGREFTSGKECFPCQVTLGDILHYLKEEKERLGSRFSADNYAYFMPESDGPCRFGMYNKLQRIVLDSFEDFRDIPIVYLSSTNAYSTAGIMPPEKSPIFRKLSYVSIVMADVIDRIIWRVRPYELRPGMTDEFMERAVKALYEAIIEFGPGLQFSRLYSMLEGIAATAASFIDPRRPRRPRIGIVGEIYVRSHTDSNQNIVRKIEEYGGEVVNASIAEWINYVSWERTRKIRRQMKLARAAGDRRRLVKLCSQWFANEIEQRYQHWRQDQVYRVVSKHLDIQHDHRIGELEHQMNHNRIYHFDIGTEAGLSIGAALGYVHEGFNGVLQTFPFTCMPSAICSAVLKPILEDMKVPYLDAPYDGSIPPNRDTALRTFVYQARQHLEFHSTS